MSNGNLNKALLANFSGQDNLLTVPKLYVRLLGKFDRAHVLNQIIFWSNKSTTQQDDWFYKSYDEWEEETLIKQKTLERIFKELEGLHLCETKVKKVRGLNKLWVKPKLDNVVYAIEQILTQSDSLSISKQTNCLFSQSDNLSVSYKEQKSTSEDYLQNNNPIVPLEKKVKKQKPQELTQEQLGKDNPHEIPVALIDEWKAIRKNPLTQRSWNAINKTMGELKVGGINPLEAFERMLERQWQSIDVSYFEKMIVERKNKVDKAEIERRTKHQEEQSRLKAKNDMDKVNDSISYKKVQYSDKCTAPPEAWENLKRKMNIGKSL